MVDSQPTVRVRAWGVALVLAGCVSTWLGAALAISLFARADAMTVLSMRLTFATAILLVIARPSLPETKDERRAVVCLGAALASMNTAIYFALDRIPMGVAVSIEMLGPLTLYLALTRRGPRTAALALTALAGVVALSLAGEVALNPAGAVAASLAAASWAAYLVLSARVGRQLDGVRGLALAMAVAAVLQLPLGLIQVDPAQLELSLLALGVVVAVASTVLPYAAEMTALRHLPTGTVAFLMAASPAVAALAGYVTLGQRLSAGQWAGLGAIVVACALVVSQRSRETSPHPRTTPSPREEPKT